MIVNKKILITGGAGFLGTKLTEKYVNNSIFLYFTSTNISVYKNTITIVKFS